MHLTTPAFLFLLALATPLAAQAAGTRAEPVDDDNDDTQTTEVEAGVVTTVTRTELLMVPVAVPRDEADNGRIEGRHRLHVESDAFAWRRSSAWGDTRSGAYPDQHTDSLNLLGGAPVFGVPGMGTAGNMTFGYGYGLRERLIVGARLGLGWQQLTRSDQSDAANRLVAFNITPYFEFVLRPGFKVRPYLGAHLGLGGSSFANATGDATRRISTIGPIFGVSAGVHAFITERVSFDASLAFDYALAYSRTRVTGSDMDQKTDFARAARLPSLALIVGLSVWLGRDRCHRDRRDEDCVSTRR